jgi:hypothetical protein
VLVGERQQLGERRQIAVHGEHAIRDNERVVVLGAMLAQQLARMRDVVMPKRLHLAA